MLRFRSLTREIRRIMKREGFGFSPHFTFIFSDGQKFQVERIENLPSKLQAKLEALWWACQDKEKLFAEFTINGSSLEVFQEEAQKMKEAIFTTLKLDENKLIKPSLQYLWGEFDSVRLRVIYDHSSPRKSKGALKDAGLQVSYERAPKGAYDEGLPGEKEKEALNVPLPVKGPAPGVKGHEQDR